jgi:hypothetical protein
MQKGFFYSRRSPLELAKFRYHEKIYLFKHSYLACAERLQTQQYFPTLLINFVNILKYVQFL